MNFKWLVGNSISDWTVGGQITFCTSHKTSHVLHCVSIVYCYNVFTHITAGCSSMPDLVCEVLVSNPTAVGGLFIMKATVRYSLNTLTAVSRTTQPSILHGTANWASPLGWMTIMTIDSNGGCRHKQHIGGPMAQVRWLGRRVGGQLVMLHIH